MKAVIYARYSAGPRQTDQSIEGQVRDCQEYASRNNIDVIRVYADRHISGKEFENRNEFQKMLRDAEKKQFDCVIAWKVDRLGRNREDLVLNKVRLRKNGVKVLYAKESIPDGPEGIILESLMEGLAEYYSVDLSQKILRGKRDSALKGLAVTGVAPLGYKIVERKYVENTEESWAIKYIFESFCNGVTYREIIDYLTQHGIRTHSGTKLSPNGVFSILRNEKYLGHCYYQDVEISLPQLVPDDLWKKAAAIIKSKAHHSHQTKGGASTGKVDYLLSLKAYCSECGALLVGESGKSHTGATHNYYKCGNRKRSSKTCDLAVWRKDDLEQLIAKHTMDDILTPINITLIAKKVAEIAAINPGADRLKSLKRQLEQNRKAMANIQKAIEMGVFTTDTKERIDELEKEKRILSDDIALESIKRPVITEGHVKYWLNKFVDGDVRDPEFLRLLFQTFVKKVEVGKEKVIVTYNCTGEYHDSDVSDCVIVGGSTAVTSVKHAGFEPATP